MVTRRTTVTQNFNPEHYTQSNFDPQTGQQRRDASEIAKNPGCPSLHNNHRARGCKKCPDCGGRL